jgi:hypothetical protein
MFGGRVTIWVSDEHHEHYQIDNVLNCCCRCICEFLVSRYIQTQTPAPTRGREAFLSILASPTGATRGALSADFGRHDPSEILIRWGYRWASDGRRKGSLNYVDHDDDGQGSDGHARLDERFDAHVGNAGHDARNVSDVHGSALRHENGKVQRRHEDDLHV